MEKPLNDIKQILLEKDIKPSQHRIKIYHYLLTEDKHPTVDIIYRDLKGEIPTLSKTTVYNTLNIFAEARLIKVFKTRDNEARYDIVTEKHGHFQCDTCGEIYDFPIEEIKASQDKLKGYLITEKSVHFTGTCPTCLNK